MVFPAGKVKDVVTAGASLWAVGMVLGYGVISPRNIPERRCVYRSWKIGTSSGTAVVGPFAVGCCLVAGAQRGQRRAGAHRVGEER